MKREGSRVREVRTPEIPTELANKFKQLSKNAQTIIMQIVFRRINKIYKVSWRRAIK